MHDELDVLTDLDQIRSRYEDAVLVLREPGAVVYRGRMRGTDRDVAIRIGGSAPLPAPHTGRRFLWQADAATREADGLLPVLAVNHLQGGAVAVVTPWERDPSVAELLTRGARPGAHRAERVLRDVAGALDRLHGAGIVHRAVSEHTVLVEPATGRARLAPFAAAAGAAEARAPEQVEGRDAAICAATDLYALARVIQMMLAPGEEEGSDPASAEPSPGLTAAVVRALNPNPSRRWRSAADMVAALDGGAPAARGEVLAALVPRLRRLGVDSVHMARSTGLRLAGSAPSRRVIGAAVAIGSIAGAVAIAGAGSPDAAAPVPDPAAVEAHRAADVTALPPGVRMEPVLPTVESAVAGLLAHDARPAAAREDRAAPQAAPARRPGRERAAPRPPRVVLLGEALDGAERAQEPRRATGSPSLLGEPLRAHGQN